MFTPLFTFQNVPQSLLFFVVGIMLVAAAAAFSGIMSAKSIRLMAIMLILTTAFLFHNEIENIISYWHWRFTK